MTDIRQTTDAYLAMYHDQGLPVLKYASFGEAVNMTLGLPFLRTSVDHGTALHLSGYIDRPACRQSHSPPSSKPLVCMSATPY